jgi:signal transduction histidine kinase
MNPRIPCPRCGKPVDAQARYCEHCHADLAIVAALAEKELSLPGEIQSGVPVTPEILVPRLGEYLVQRGAVNQADLDRALAYQVSQTARGYPTLLGQALRELDLISPEDLDQAVTVQIIQLQNALRQSNRELEARVQERTRELEAAFAKLAELNQLKSNFLANISHELRTPLTHLKGYLELWATGDLGELTRYQVDALEVMRRAEARLERLIEDLIQFALVSRGKLTLQIQPVELAQIVHTAIEQVEMKARAGDVQVRAALPHKLPWVSCDPEKIGWVLIQLLDNAVKFTGRGGSVRIEANLQKTFVTIAVIDTGIGMPEDRLGEIFEPFHQLDGSATRRYGGTGLGLALSNSILSAHETLLRVESMPGVGSRFEFNLPVAHHPMGE